MPSYAAGPRPATVRLAQTSSQCIKETLNRYLPLPSSATKPANSVAPKPQIIARNRVRPRRSHKPSRSNLHSAPQPPVSLTAVSFPGGFRTPAPVQAASSRWAIIRNPSHKLPWMTFGDTSAHPPISDYTLRCDNDEAFRKRKSQDLRRQVGQQRPGLLQIARIEADSAGR
jgi:hypothetical protein